MALIDIYCEFEFLETFYTSCPQIKNKAEYLSARYWYELDRLLFRNQSRIYLDITKKILIDLAEGDNPTGIAVQELISAHAENKISEILFEQTITGLKNIKYTIFLTKKSKDECKQLEEEFGLIFISKDNYLESLAFLFSSDIKLINETTKDLNFLKQYRHPCNEIILVDNYILSQKKLNSNSIKQLFDALLPIKLKGNSFNVIIYANSKDKKDSEDSKFPKIDYPANKNEIQQSIEALRDYTINVKYPENINEYRDYEKMKEDNNLEEYFKAENHDRYLLTNYCFFSIGYGFNVNKKVKMVGTNLVVYPLTYQSDYYQSNNANIVDLIKYIRDKNYNHSTTVTHPYLSSSSPY